MSPNDADGMANNVDPDQTAPPLGAVWSGSTLFTQTCLSENLGKLRVDPIINPEDLAFIEAGTFNIPNNISDHKTTFIKLPFRYDTEEAFYRLVWLSKKAKQKLTSYDWNCLLGGSLDVACSKFTSVF